MSQQIKSKTLAKMITTLAAAIVLAACSNKQDPSSLIKSVSLSTDQLAKYEASCKACHEIAGAGAPVRGDAQAWERIFQQPVEEIMNKVVNGYQGMPPLGQCFDCDQQDLESLAYYLAMPKDKTAN